MYSYVFNSVYNIKNNTQYHYEPIFWKLNSILNDSVLSIYVLFLIITYMLYNYNYKSITLTVILLVYVFLQSYKSQFIFSNLIKSIPYNTTLFNGLLLIHPLCLYLSYGYIVYVYMSTKKTKLTLGSYFQVNNEKKYLFVTCSIVALILGCWWAQQEISWGGWWNWDPIEMIALIVFIISVALVHVKVTSQYVLTYVKQLIIAFIILTYFVSRYDILNSIHSFALSSKSQHYLELKLFCLYYVLWVMFYNNKLVFMRLNSALNAFVLPVIFFIYYGYAISNILKDITVSSIYEISTLNTNYKYQYIILLITTIFILNTPRMRGLTTAITLIALTVLTWLNMYKVLTIIIIIYFFKKNQPNIYRLCIKNKIIIIHVVLAIILFLALLYSNVEIFFTKFSVIYYYMSGFGSSTVQLTKFDQNIFLDESFFHKVKREVFLQNNNNFIKLLSQHISTNVSFNINKIELSKLVYFIQNYLYYYIILWATAYTIWYIKIYKSGIV